MAVRKGWFAIPGVQKGDRTIEDQLKGLDELIRRVPGHTVMDLGCAEGLVSKALLAAGAAHSWGIDVVPAAIEAAHMQQMPNGSFRRYDLNEQGALTRAYADTFLPKTVDIVLALALLHKLHSPGALVKDMLAFEPDLIVVRTPADTPGFVYDRRSHFKKYDIIGALAPTHALVHTSAGHFNEWVGYFELRL